MRAVTDAAKTIAVTGATGFVGRHVLAELWPSGMQAAALVRDPAGRGYCRKRDAGYRATCRTRRRWTSSSTGADAVVHLAGAIAALGRREFFAVNERDAALAEAAHRARRQTLRAYVVACGAGTGLSALCAQASAPAEDAFSQLRGHDERRSSSGRLPSMGRATEATLPLIQQLTRPLRRHPGTAPSRFSLIHVEDLARIPLLRLDENWTGHSRW